MTHSNSSFSPYAEIILKLRKNNPAFEYMLRKYEAYDQQITTCNEEIDLFNLQQSKKELEQEILTILKKVSF